MKLYRNMGNVVILEIEIHYCYTFMNGVVFHADSTEREENRSSLKYNEKKIFLLID